MICTSQASKNLQYWYPVGTALTRPPIAKDKLDFENSYFHWLSMTMSMYPINSILLYELQVTSYMNLIYLVEELKGYLLSRSYSYS